MLENSILGIPSSSMASFDDNENKWKKKIPETYELTFTEPKIGIHFSKHSERALAVKSVEEGITKAPRMPRPGALLVGVNGRLVIGGLIKPIVELLKSRFWSEEKPLCLIFSDAMDLPVLSASETAELDRLLSSKNWLLEKNASDPAFRLDTDV
uniref:Uncharacterized protein n=1 Tax=Octactis speculum TaxID=3111310 RepID=A0A7S2F4F4_9STRA|mmetsp:Transcript_12917/g.17012  ORF Transcript_12917/g.17012 Transcript_12917/m.17012 type:complete len:154 (+) Transcript_12917:230-691(+)